MQFNIFLVVPAAHVPGHSLQTESRDRAFTAQRLQAGLEQFRALGVDVDGEVGDRRPMDAMLDAPPFDEIVLSTLPSG
ncbi:MAG: hypothetical protein ACR2GF_03530 [Acidimicrobiales bacterium]